MQKFGEIQFSNSKVDEARMFTAGDDQYSGLFHYYSLGGDTARPGGLHAFLV